MSDAIELSWQFTRDDHVAYLWSAMWRRWPAYAASAVIPPGILAILLGVVVSPGLAGLVGIPLVGAFALLVMVRLWARARRRTLADVDRRPQSLAPVSVRLDASGIHVVSEAAGGSVGWEAVTDVRLRGGFLVVMADGTVVLTVPLRYVPDPQAVMARVRAWRERPAPPEDAEPLPDAVYDVTYRLTPGDYAAVSRGQLVAQYRERLVRTVGNAIAYCLIAWFLVVLAVLVPGSFTWLLLIAAVASAFLGSLPLWTLLARDLRTRRRASRRPTMTAETQLRLGPEGLWIRSAASVARREWAAITSIERNRRFVYLRLSAARVLAIPLAAIPGEVDAFVADLRKWKQEAPALKVSLPQAPRATGTSSDNPFEPPQD